MRQHAVLVLILVALGAAYGCSDESGGVPVQANAGVGGTAGTAGAGAGGSPGTGGSAGAGGVATNGGAAGAAAVPPTPALQPGAASVACPTTIDGVLDSGDRSQTGRHSRIAPVAACGMTKGFPGNAADPSNPHLYDVYRFANPTAAPVCFSFTLTYGSVRTVDIGDAGADAGAASTLDAGGDAGTDAGAGAAGTGAAATRYLTAYSTFYPTDLSLGFLADVGDALTSPQAMGVTVPAGGTIDVVVYAIDIAPAGVGSYSLSCAAQ